MIHLLRDTKVPVPSKSLDRQAAALLTLALVGYPAIAPIAILAQLPSYVVSMPFRALVLALALSVLARSLVTQVRVRMTPFWIVFSVFWTLYVSRMIVDAVLAPETLRLPLSDYLLYALGTCLLPALAVYTRVSANVLRGAYYGTLGLGVIAIMANLAVMATQLSAQTLAAFFTGRLASKTLDSISLAHLGITVFTLGAWGLIKREVRGVIPVFVLFAALVAGFAAAMMAASRGPLLTLVVVGPLLLWHGLHADRRGTALLGAVVALPALVLFWVMRNVENVYILTRLRGLASDEIRRGLWQSGWDLFLAKPFLGGGTEPLGFYPHNTVIESFILFGMFSGVLYCALLVISACAAMKVVRTRLESGWAALVFFQVSIGMMVSGALYGSPSQWVLMGIVIGLCHGVSGRSASRVFSGVGASSPQYIPK